MENYIDLFEHQVLVATMGDSNYKNCEYYDNEYNYLTTNTFSLLAALIWLEAKQIEINTVIIMRTKNEKVKQNIEQLSTMIESRYPKTNIYPIDIDSNYDVLQISTQMIDWLHKQQKTKIQTFNFHSDITNGFRTFPLILQNTIRYISANEYVRSGFTIYANTYKSIPDEKK